MKGARAELPLSLLTSRLGCEMLGRKAVLMKRSKGVAETVRFTANSLTTFYFHKRRVLVPPNPFLPS